ncbi:hypothetical protein, partial [Acetobacter senegalensis]|uniref:hypothetical protein n=1 Tax=Acetobacter senegalensis TaxID=446692 RepID=UPI001D03E8BA
MMTPQTLVNVPAVRSIALSGRGKLSSMLTARMATCLVVLPKSRRLAPTAPDLPVRSVIWNQTGGSRLMSVISGAV